MVSWYVFYNRPLSFYIHCAAGVCYLEVVLQLLPPLLQWFGPQVGVPFAREIWNLYDFPELHEK